ncbi:MAG: hypothetical protein IH914_08835, partial [candidate division Zixibacteria bacterium]|nr:hypothetical protein [candidate division Zixibacteria bacterium]
SASGAWAGGSLAEDLLVFTTLGGTTVALGPQPDRERLDILNPESQANVPFGTPSATPVVFENIFSNSGCANLVIDSVRLSDTPNFTTASGGIIAVSSVSPALLRRMNEVANYTTNASLFQKVGLMLAEAPQGLDPFGSLNFDATESGLNYRAAIGFPAVVTPGTGPDGSGVLFPAPGAQVPPGDSVDLVIAIEGPAVTRGPHTFYATLWTSDPDYFLDDPSAAPEVALTVTGGCLEDSVRIHFGSGGANSTTVYNTGLVARFPSGANDIDINGYSEGAALCGTPFTELFGGMRGFSLTPRRIAMTGPSWDGDDYQTILGDLNYCSNTCQPQLKTNVLLGAISHDSGLTYDPVFGDLAATTYIDSAQDYSAGTGVWDTRVFPNKLLNDSTIGIIIDETHYGVLDVPELADFRLIRIDVTNRSATDSIVDLVHWAHHDDDIGAIAANSVQGIPGSAGYAYAAAPGLGIVHGYVKVPSGCGLGNDVMRAAALDQSASWFAWEAIQHYDSIYQFARLPQFDSIHFQSNMNTFDGESGAAADASVDYYFGGINLAPGETRSFGIAQFVKVDCVNLDPNDDDQFIGFADLVNKWAGFHRGDLNNDLQIDLADIVYLANIVAGSANGAFPFAHLSDVNNDALTDLADLAYLVNFYFNGGPCPIGDWTIALCSQ